MCTSNYASREPTGAFEYAFQEPSRPIIKIKLEPPRASDHSRRDSSRVDVGTLLHQRERQRPYTLPVFTNALSILPLFTAHRHGP